MRRWIPLFIQTRKHLKEVYLHCRADFSFWVVRTILIYLGGDFLICILHLGFDQFMKGDKNILCSYTIFQHHVESPLCSKENDGSPDHKLLLVDKGSPSSGQEVASWCPAIYVAELPDFLLDIVGENQFHARVGGVVEEEKYCLDAVTGHEEAASIIWVAPCCRA